MHAELETLQICRVPRAPDGLCRSAEPPAHPMALQNPPCITSAGSRNSCFELPEFRDFTPAQGGGGLERGVVVPEHVRGQLCGGGIREACRPECAGGVCCCQPRSSVEALLSRAVRQSVVRLVASGTQANQNADVANIARVQRGDRGRHAATGTAAGHCAGLRFQDRRCLRFCRLGLV